MVALDPLMSAISDTLDTHVNRQVRQALDPLARIADRTGAIVAGIAHFNKSGGTDASSLITASGAFKDVARFIFAFAADDDDGTKVITQTKNSLGHSDLPSLRLPDHRGHRADRQGRRQGRPVRPRRPRPSAPCRTS